LQIAKELKKRNINYIGELIHIPTILYFLHNNCSKLLKTYKLFEDRDSREIFSSLFKYALTCDPFVIKISKFSQYFHPEIFPSKEDIMVDGGAYIGDTIEAIHKNFGGIRRIYAFEPDKSNYLTLLKNTNHFKEVICFNAGLWSRDDTLMFNKQAQSNSCISRNGSEKVVVYSLSSFLKKIKEKPTLIKMDIEGAEMEALKGAKDIIIKHKPKLQICVYHEASHMYEIPLILKEWVPEYKMWLGHHSESWDETVLYCKVM